MKLRAAKAGDLQKVQAAKMNAYDLSTAPLAVPEPQHGLENLQADFEHGREWVTCRACGRQWAIHGSTAELVTDGDDSCDDSCDEGDS